MFQNQFQSELAKIRTLQLTQIKNILINQARRYKKLLIIANCVYVLNKYKTNAFSLELIPLEETNSLLINISNIVNIKLGISKNSLLNELDKDKTLDMLYLLLDKDYKIFSKAYEDNHNNLSNKTLMLDKIKDKNLINFIYNYPKNVITKKVNSLLNTRYLKTLKTKYALDLKQLTVEINEVLDKDSKIDFSYVIENKPL